MIFSWLNPPRGARLLAVVTLLVVLPSLSLGFFSDDYAFLSVLEGTAAWSPPWWDLYNFIPGDAALVSRLREQGILPWWSADGLRLHLVRPLPSALLQLDHRLFGRWALGYHLHSALYYFALVALVHRLFRRLFEERTATLAALLFAISGAHGSVYAWISCRHLLVAGVFGVGAILVHLHALAERRWSCGLLSAGLLAIALAGSEAALGLVGYLLWARLPPDAARPTLRERLPLLVPPLVVSAAYLVFYKLVGGGSIHGGTYVDPLSSPVRFLRLGAERFPMLLATALTGLPVEASAGTGAVPLIVLGVLATGAAMLLYRAARPAIPAPSESALRWLLPSALLSICVGLGGIPGSRQLVLANLFFAPLFALLLVHGFASREGGGALALLGRRAGVAVLALLHLPLAVMVGLAGVTGMKTMAADVRRIAASPAIEPHARTFLLGTSDPLIVMYTPPVRLVESGQPLRCWVPLAMTKGDIRVERIADNEIVFETLGTEMLRNAFETLTWDPAVPMPVDRTVSSCGARVRVVATREGRPYRVAVQLDKNLDDPEVRLIHWESGELRPLRLGVGESRTLRWSPGPMGLL